MYSSTVKLKNNTNNKITIGIVNFPPKNYKEIYSKNNTKNYMNIVREILSNIRVFNEEIFNGGLSLYEDNIVKNSNETFLIIDKLFKIYNDYSNNFNKIEVKSKLRREQLLQVH